jgi:hypothetical protein
MNGYSLKNQGRMAAVPPMLTNETLMGSDRVHFFFRASTKPFQRSAKTAAKIARVAASNFQMFEFPILSFHQKRPQRFFSWPRPISPQPLKHTTGTGAESHISHASPTESEHLARRRQCTTVPPRHHSLLTSRCSVQEDVVKQAGAAPPTKAHTAPFVLHHSRAHRAGSCSGTPSTSAAASDLLPDSLAYRTVKWVDPAPNRSTARNQSVKPSTPHAKVGV